MRLTHPCIVGALVPLTVAACGDDFDSNSGMSSSSMSSGAAGSAAEGGTGSGGSGGEGGHEPCDGACSAPTPLCDEANDACVECLGNTDCTNPEAAKCEAGACAPCTESEQCASHSGAEVCNEGTCVECTPTDANACGVNACNPVTHACSAFAAASRTVCESCDTDENCSAADHFCVPMEYMAVPRDGYCLKTSTPSCERPYSIEITGRTTLSGETGLSFCGINENLATCEAVLALVNGQQCLGGQDSECPESGLCKKVGTLEKQCTYACSDATECKNPPVSGSTCGDGDNSPPGWCGG